MSYFRDKVRTLRRRFREFESAVVALSGGVDSSVLAKIAHQELGTRMIAVTASSPSVPSRDFEAAKEFCDREGIPHLVVTTGEFNVGAFCENTAERCYYCKNSLYERLGEVAHQKSFKVIVEGTTASDLTGHRPGFRASRENEWVVTPLVECDFTKDDVRALARELGLGDVAEKPATACLSSRVPTGVPLDPASLQRIDRAEEALRELGVGQVRVRHHGSVARIEVNPADIPRLIEQRTAVDDALRALGYRYVTVDLKGYRPATPES